ncbi:hypothetical protein ACTFQ7_27370 [Bacillus cereus group sp. MYBK226-2]|nr:hypothetical protein [Bacillus anthracis]MCX9102980.1 hypothetical protein [Bacillus anthracis]MDA2621282.1 hypothetical protein [Bacillus cereus]
MMEESTLSLAIVAATICLFAYLVHRIDVWDKKTGWSRDDK